MGTWLSKPGEVEGAIQHAIKTGYRHLDLAKIYGNHHEIGAALKSVVPSVVKREDLFITDKLWNNSHKPELVKKAFEQTLEELDLEYLDLYLIHWPVAFDGDLNTLLPVENDVVKLDLQTSLVDTWKAMIEIKNSGKAKSIGVSNFSVAHIEAITKATGVVPAVNQIEAHPLLPQDELRKWHEDHNIVITAYSPLGNNTIGHKLLTEYPEVIEIAKKYNADPGQILIAWGVKRGYVVIPKSVTLSRIEKNFNQIDLSDEDYQRLSDMIKMNGKEQRFNTPVYYAPKWNINIFSSEEEKDMPHQIKVE